MCMCMFGYAYGNGTNKKFLSCIKRAAHNSISVPKFLLHSENTHTVCVRKSLHDFAFGIALWPAQLVCFLSLSLLSRFSFSCIVSGNYSHEVAVNCDAFHTQEQQKRERERAKRF